MKKATFYINGEIFGSYTQEIDQSNEDFQDEVLRIKAECIYEGYQEFNYVQSLVKVEEL